MAAFVKSRERITVTFPGSDSTITTNLTKGQDEAKCSAHHTLRTTTTGTDFRDNESVRLVMVDNGGTAAVQATRTGSSTRPELVVEIEVIEWGANVTVQQGSVSLTGTSATATISNIGAVNRGFILLSQSKLGTTGSDDWDDTLVRASFNSTTEIQFNRNIAGPPDWTISYFVISSNGTDFLTEYIDYTMASNEGGPTNQTLSNTIDLSSAFLIVTGQSSETGDDMRQAVAHAELTGTNQITFYRNSGFSLADTFRFGVWVVRCATSDITVQRFTVDISSLSIYNQTITSSDLDKTAIFGSFSIHYNHLPINSSQAGEDINAFLLSIIQTSTTNVRLQKRTGSPPGSNTNARFEVVEFELESAGPAPQIIPVGLVSETDSVEEVKPVAGAVSVAIGTVSETDSVFAVTPEIGGAPQTVPVGLVSETDFVDEVKAVPGTVSVSVGAVAETDTVFTVDPVITKEPQTVAVGLISEADTVLEVKPVPGAFVVPVEPITELDQVAPVFPVLEGGPQTVLVLNVAEIDTVFPVTPRLAGEEIEGGGIPIRPRKRSRKTRRYILPDNRIFTDPERALYELREWLKAEKATAQAESGGEATLSEPLDASRGQEILPPDTAQDQPITPQMLQSAVSDLPELLLTRPETAQSLDPQLISVLFQMIDDEEAAMLLL